MAVNKIRKFNTIDSLTDFLNGGIEGADIQNTGSPPEGFIGLTGKTLKIGVTTVTFVATSNNNTDQFFLGDVKSQIETAVNTVLVKSNKGRLVIIEKTPTSGLTIDKAGTANSILGFDTQNNTVSKVYTPPSNSPLTAPQWVWLESSSENSYLICTWE